MEKLRYSGAIIAAVGELKAQRPELARSIDNALVGGRNKSGPTARFEAVVRLARQGVWRPIENLLTHPYYKLEQTETPQDELVNTRLIFYQLAQEDLLYLEAIGDGEKSLSVQTLLDEADTFEDMFNIYNGITFLAAKCRLQQKINEVLKAGCCLPFASARMEPLYQDFLTAENTADLAGVQQQVECMQGQIEAFHKTFKSFGN